MQVYDEIKGEYITHALKVVMKVIPKKYTLGNLDVAVNMGTNGEFELTYMKVSIDGVEKVEVDKIAYIYRVNGIDYLAKVRQDLGMN